jgi:hypothetical protein
VRCAAGIEDRRALDSRIAQVASVELAEGPLSTSRPVSDARRRGESCGRGRDGSGPGSVFRKIGDPFLVTDRKVIQITQARLGDRLPKTPRRRKLTPYRPQTPAMPGWPYTESQHYQCDLNHIAGFEPVLSSQHQNVMHASLQAFNSEGLRQ